MLIWKAKLISVQWGPQRLPSPWSFTRCQPFASPSLQCWARHSNHTGRLAFWGFCFHLGENTLWVWFMSKPPSTPCGNCRRNELWASGMFPHFNLLCSAPSFGLTFVYLCVIALLCAHRGSSYLLGALSCMCVSFGDKGCPSSTISLSPWCF